MKNQRNCFCRIHAKEYRVGDPCPSCLKIFALIWLGVGLVVGTLCTAIVFILLRF
jgi:hypothetical protein